MLKDIVAKEGVGRLYKGIAAPFAMEAPKRATKCESQAASPWGCSSTEATEADGV